MVPLYPAGLALGLFFPIYSKSPRGNLEFVGWVEGLGGKIACGVEGKGMCLYGRGVDSGCPLVIYAWILCSSLG